MKNKWFWLVAIFLAFVLVACSNGNCYCPDETIGITIIGDGENAKLQGTWIGISDIAGLIEMQYIFTGNDFLQRLGSEDLFKGTFISSKTEIQLNHTHVWYFEKWRAYPPGALSLIQYVLLDVNTLEILSVGYSEADVSVGVYKRQ
jgi:hypothetical protein